MDKCVEEYIAEDDGSVTMFVDLARAPAFADPVLPPVCSALALLYVHEVAEPAFASRWHCVLRCEGRVSFGDATQQAAGDKPLWFQFVAFDSALPANIATASHFPMRSFHTGSHMGDSLRASPPSFPTLKMRQVFGHVIRVCFCLGVAQ